MNRPAQAQKHFQSARQRFLQPSIESFLERELTSYFGPVVRRAISQELARLVEDQLPHREFLRPGQCVWLAVSKDTRPDSPRRRLVPVVLTLVAPNDVDDLAQGARMSEIARRSVARLTQEAYEQGALLSMRDIGLLVWRTNAAITTYRKQWEAEYDQTLPHPGSLQDFGSCISHKTTIIRKVVYEKQDPRKVAYETRHSQEAVDRYLKSFYRVRTAYQHCPDLKFVSQTTGLSPQLVQQYVQLIELDRKDS